MLRGGRGTADGLNPRPALSERSPGPSRERSAGHLPPRKLAPETPWSGGLAEVDEDLFGGGGAGPLALDGLGVEGGDHAVDGVGELGELAAHGGPVGGQEL